MEHADAVRIIRDLAEGFDPLTREPLADDHLCQRPAVVRAMFVALGDMDTKGRARRRQESSPAKSGLPWSPQDDAALAAAFDAGAPLEALALGHERSVYAVKLRLVKLGKLEPGPEHETLPAFRAAVAGRNGH